MKHQDINFDAATTHKILKNLCVTLTVNDIDYTCAFVQDNIYAIKCDKYVIAEPIIKTTSLMYKVYEENGILLGLFDTKNLLELLTPKRIEFDPCDKCNRNLCYGCPHSEE